MNYQGGHLSGAGLHRPEAGFTVGLQADRA